MRYLKTYKLFESKSSLKFVKQPSKKGAKTETYNVVKDDNVIGQIKWSSRMRGYAFLPEKDHDEEVKSFIKELMSKRKKSKLLESNWHEQKDHIDVLSDMSLALFDKDFNVEVDDEVIDVTSEKICIVVNIVKKGFTYPEMKEELLEMVGYMDREGWEILNIEYLDPAFGNAYLQHCGELKPDSLFSSRIDSKILISHGYTTNASPLNQLIVKFVEKKEVKTNESLGKNEEHIKVLNDICLDLSDQDYSFTIQEIKGYGSIRPDSIRVFVCGKPNVSGEWMLKYKPFTYDDVRDFFEVMIDYMDSESFEIHTIAYSTPEDPASHNHLKYYNGELLTLRNSSKVDSFYHLEISFTEKEVKTNESTEESIHREMMIKKYGEENIEECDEVIKNIGYMALELEDLGIDVIYGYSPLTLLYRDYSPKISVSIIADEKLFAGKIADIHIFKDTLLGYVKSLGFSTGQNTSTSDYRKVDNQILIQK